MIYDCSAAKTGQPATLHAGFSAFCDDRKQFGHLAAINRPAELVGNAIASSQRPRVRPRIPSRIEMAAELRAALALLNTHVTEVRLREARSADVQQCITPLEARTRADLARTSVPNRSGHRIGRRSLLADYLESRRKESCEDALILDALRSIESIEPEGAEGTFRRASRGSATMRRIPDGLIPESVLNRYEIYNWRNAAQVLAGSYPSEWQDILEILGLFVLRKSEVVSPGGRKSKISDYIDAQFSSRGWKERQVSYKLSIDEETRESSTHKIDCYRNRIGLECEWNSKDQTFVRDLNTFRILFDMQILDVGCIVTRSDHLQEIFDSLGPEIGKKYGPSTTHMGKLLPRLQSGGGGGCPVLVFGITRALYDPNS